MAYVEALPDGERGAVLALEEVEVALLQSLAMQMVDFVGPRSAPSQDPLAAMVGIDALAETPDDPALLRLLPDAFIDDPDAAGEFRRFTERDLREGKVRNAMTVHAALAEAAQEQPSDVDAEDGHATEIRVAGDDVSAWLGFLNDTRLTLGSRLELTEDNHDELESLPDSDPRSGLFQVYDWLTFLQESIVQRLLPGA